MPMIATAIRIATPAEIPRPARATLIKCVSKIISFTYLVRSVPCSDVRSDVYIVYMAIVPEEVNVVNIIRRNAMACGHLLCLAGFGLAGFDWLADDAGQDEFAGPGYRLSSFLVAEQRERAVEQQR